MKYYLIVSHLMIVKITGGRKPFATHSTLMWFFSSMNSPTIYKYLPETKVSSSYLWVLRLELVENPFLQTGQICGFSPVWVLMCLFSRLGLSNSFPQTLQGSIVFFPGLRPGPVLWLGMQENDALGVGRRVEFGCLMIGWRCLGRGSWEENLEKEANCDLAAW